MTYKNPVLTFPFLLITLLLGCKYQDNIWGDSYNFPDSEWSADEKICFCPDSLSLAKKSCGKICLFIRYGSDMSLSEIPMILEYEVPSEKDGYFSDTITMMIRKSPGKTKMNIKAPEAAVKESADTIYTPVKLTPGSSITLRPANPNLKITDIYSLGVMMLP